MNETPNPMLFTVEEEWCGKWETYCRKDSLTSAIMSMVHTDATSEVQKARRVVGPENELIAMGRWCDLPTPTNAVRKFWIVAPTDEQINYASREDAVDEARASGKDARMGVFELVHVSGWVDIAVEDGK